MQNDRRLEITGKIVTVEQIEKVADYLLETKNNYDRLIKEDKQKNQDAYITHGDYNYYTNYMPKLEYEINYEDGRSTKTEDIYVFKDALKEPRYLKSINMQFYLKYSDNQMGEETKHDMSLYLTIRTDSIYFSTSDEHMEKEAYNFNSYIRGILEEGPDHYDFIAKKKRWIKLIVGTGFGSILSVIAFFIGLYLKSTEMETIVTLFKTPFLLTMLGWTIAVAFGTFCTTPIMSSLYHEIDKSLNSFSKEWQKKKIENYKEANEILIGENVNNLEKRETIKKIYNIAKPLVLLHLGFSMVVLVVLSVIGG